MNYELTMLTFDKLNAAEARVRELYAENQKLIERNKELETVNEFMLGAEAVVRRAMVQMWVDCICGMADAAIITDGTYGVGHVMAAVKQLSDYAKELRKAQDEKDSEYQRSCGDSKESFEEEGSTS